MVSRLGLSVLLVLLSLFGLVQAAPLADKLRRLSPGARDVLKRSTPAAPHFAVYNDRWTSPFPSSSELEGFNVFIITFLLLSGATDQALGWEELTASQQSSYLSEYNAAGISLVVSAFGATDEPTTSGADPVATANTMATWVQQNGVQGIDVDYEDFDAFEIGVGTAEAWLISFTTQLRARLPQGEYILTHAPVAPWFSPDLWSGGGYLEIDRSVGSMIDWYNVQFYNQGSSEYTTCSGLLTASSQQWPESALFQIAANGVSVDKLVIGKPGTGADASTGYVDPGTLSTCVAQAVAQGWDAGVMAWQYPDAGSAWITTVRGTTWPVAGPAPPPVAPTATSTSAVSPTNTPTTSSTSAVSPTGTPTSGNCAGVAAWVDDAAYVNGNQVTYNGNLWTATTWNEDEVPGGLSGAWANDGPCA